MTLPALRDDGSTSEWFRLSAISDKYEPKMRLAYTRAMRNGKTLDKLELTKTIIDCVAEVGITTADAYGIVFNPNSPIYLETVERLVDKYHGSVESKEAQNAVRQILPAGLSLEDRRRRLNTFGLDTKSAVEIERYRQAIGDGVTHLRDVERVRLDAIRTRGNLLAITETNRVVNGALEALWIDNQGISKAEVLYYDASIKEIGNIPKRARKEIITRRDNRVCRYCEPLDGTKARLGEEFETKYGFFMSPPFHPRCRCFMIVSL